MRKTRAFEPDDVLVLTVLALVLGYAVGFVVGFVQGAMVWF